MNLVTTFVVTASLLPLVYTIASHHLPSLLFFGLLCTPFGFVVSFHIASLFRKSATPTLQHLLEDSPTTVVSLTTLRSIVILVNHLTPQIVAFVARKVISDSTRLYFCVSSVYLACISQSIE
ncbi:hypothetical protein BJ912DRAFT_436069 [Pholiota molesta]|nr:hypothetical protein BJ912DRAFT_436069 [Pholiota molesta]